MSGGRKRCMRRTGAAFLLTVSLFAFFGACRSPAPKPPPDEKRVAETLAEMKRRKTDELKGKARADHVLSLIGRWLKDHGFYLRMIIIGGAIAAAAILIILFIRFIAARQYRLSPPVGAASPEEAETPPPDPAELSALEAAGEYAQAIVLLHRLTVAYCTARGLVSTGNLTNNAIAERLSDPRLRGVFCAVAQASERILFDREEAGKDDYIRCLNAYRRAFRDGRA